ncbi:MAG TPA: hypothetical protein VK502_02760 [Candidatus Saccharimonadales bacterium]|nr:hypothetical protein [Candidatus Saccharimonadales bacterium]
MAGNKLGGQKAAAKNLARDPNFYAKIGARGGQNGKTGGFASNVVGKDGLTGAERARIAGANGGRISRRKKASTTQDDVAMVTSQDDVTLAA